MYFYTVRRDKNGNMLTTSYGKQAQAEKYGGAGAKITKDMFYLTEDGKVTKEETPRVLRSKLVSQAQEGEGEGRFVLYSEKDGQFASTSFRFGTYGAANTGMKSLAQVLGTLVVVEEEYTPTAEPENEHDEENDVAPF